MSIPTSLTHAALHFWLPMSDEDQAVARPNLIHPAPGGNRDPVSTGVAILARQLRFLDLRALVTKDLFPAADAQEEHQWRHMRRMRIEFHPLRPDGRWYFVGPHGEDPYDSEDGGYEVTNEHYPPEIDTEEDEDLDMEFDKDPNGGSEYDRLPDMFRTEPCRERIEPLLAAFAQSVAQCSMPDLEEAELFTYLWWCPGISRAPKYGLEAYDFDSTTHRWGVRYTAGSLSEGEVPTVTWHVGDWRPSEETMRLFDTLGRQEWHELKPERERSGRTYTLTSELFTSEVGVVWK